METKGPIAGLLASRKGVLTLLVLIMATLLEVAIIVLAIRGKMTIDVAIQTSLGTLFVGTLGAITTINGIAKEDAASKTVAPIAAGVDVTKTQVTPEVAPKKVEGGS